MSSRISIGQGNEDFIERPGFKNHMGAKAGDYLKRQKHSLSETMFLSSIPRPALELSS